MSQESEARLLSEREIDLWHWGMEGLILLDIFLSSPHQFSFSKIAPFITELVNNIKSSKVQFVEQLPFYQEKMTATELAARLKRNPSHACQYIAALFHYVAVDFFSKPSMPHLQNLLTLPSDFQTILDAQKGNLRSDISALPINRSGLNEYLAIREKVRDSIDYLLGNGIVSADQYKMTKRKVRHILNPSEPEEDHIEQMSNIVAQSFELWENEATALQERDLDLKNWALEGLKTVYHLTDSASKKAFDSSVYIENLKILVRAVEGAGVTLEFDVESAVRQTIHLSITQLLAFYFSNNFHWQQINTSLRKNKQVMYEYLAHTFLRLAKEILSEYETSSLQSNDEPILQHAYKYRLHITDFFEDSKNRGIWSKDELDSLRAFVTTAKSS